ncbi:MAG: YicC family protein [Gammaproteobacteria bacterium]|nr:YicC family protein [Gammaproteobacteria bacterium]
MTLSMTAFARRGTDTPGGSLVWELRSVNHRYLDVSMRLPEDLRAIETGARETIGARLERGKIEVTLKFQPRESVAGLALDSEAARKLLAAARDVNALAAGLAPISVTDVLRWPGVLRSPGLDAEALSRAALELLGSTLDELIATRMREGTRLRGMLEDRLRTIGDILGRLATLLPEIAADYRTRLEARLGEIRNQLDTTRLEQEMVLHATRSDVAEEVDRLNAHVAEVQRVLGGKGQVGRRLDFLMQELNREANTLASKSVDLRQTNAAVELKVLIEQMREQVQNIE